MTDEERAEIKDARQNLRGALIDIERAHGYADAVCIDTIKRVIDQMRSLEDAARHRGGPGTASKDAAHHR